MIKNACFYFRNVFPIDISKVSKIMLKTSLLNDILLFKTTTNNMYLISCKKTKYTIYCAKFARYTLSSNKCHAHVQKCIYLNKSKYM